MVVKLGVSSVDWGEEVEWGSNRRPPKAVIAIAVIATKLAEETASFSFPPTLGACCMMGAGRLGMTGATNAFRTVGRGAAALATACGGAIRRGRMCRPHPLQASVSACGLVKMVLVPQAGHRIRIASSGQRGHRFEMFSVTPNTILPADLRMRQ